MEILMKLKCTPSTPTHGSATHPTLKVVDHHHQLAQQHTAQATSAPPSLVRLPSANVNYGQAELPLTAPSLPIPTTCLEYAANMECCSAAAAAAAAAAQQEIEILDIQWEQQRRGLYENMAHRTQSCCKIKGNTMFETPSCCSGIVYGAPPPPQASAPAQLPPLQQAPYRLPLVVVPEVPLDINTAVDLNTHYEYKEPEENFVSIEDAKIKGFLMKIGQQSLKERAETEKIKKRQTITKANNNEQAILYEIIDLDDEDDREELRQIKNQVESANQRASITISSETITPIAAKSVTLPKQINAPSISLIPKSCNMTILVSKPVHNAANERIIAHIELSDSSDSEAEDQTHPVKQVAVGTKTQENANVTTDSSEESDDEEMPLAAASVSCELDCDEDDNENKSVEINTQHDGNSSDDVVVLNTDDENIDVVEKREETVEVQWEDLEEHKERTFFECYLCGKKVQSSYNLRRHMMIHTGERPFGCDMCDRRFREFSDLKKHRRRHANDPNFVCMVCRINSPMSHDPTRCTACDSKTSAITAAMRPQITSLEKSQSPSSQPPPPLTAAPTRRPSRNPTPTVTSGPVPAPAPTPTTNSISITIVTSNRDAKLSSPKQVDLVATQSTGSPEPTPPQQHADMPSLVPITSTITKPTTTQLLLDSIPIVHRPSYNQLGVITRREFPCPLCQRPFGTRHNLKRHFMIHTGEKPFSCSKCRKPFREYSTLKKHMVTHQRDRFYKCLRCPKKYRDYLEYNEHKKMHPSDEVSWETGTSSVPSPSKRAKLRYTNDSSYDSNEEDSSAEDWLECCECKQRFTDIETYTEHLKEHDPGLYLYECYICKKSFKQRDDLVEHMSACKEELRETALNRAKCAG